MRGFEPRNIASSVTRRQDKIKPNFSKNCSKNQPQHLLLKNVDFILAEKALKYLGNFCKKICCPKVSKISQSGRTDRKPPLYQQCSNHCLSVNLFLSILAGAYFIKYFLLLTTFGCNLQNITILCRNLQQLVVVYRILPFYVEIYSNWLKFTEYYLFMQKFTAIGCSLQNISILCRSLSQNSVISKVLRNRLLQWLRESNYGPYNDLIIRPISHQQSHIPELTIL